MAATTNVFSPAPIYSLKGLTQIVNTAPTPLLFLSVGLVFGPLISRLLPVSLFWIAAFGLLAAWGFEALNYAYFLARRGTIRGAVVITGAGTGIGKDAALTLHKDGLDVYAGVLNVQEGEALLKEANIFSSSRSKIVPLILDVTNEAQIREAVQRVASEVGSQGLLALVNNAGITGWGPLETLSIPEIQRVMDINLYGQLRMLNGFAPLLHVAEKTGVSPRVVWLGSFFGSVSVPGLAPYVMSKHALEAAAHTFARECMNTRIRSSVISPFIIQTPIWQKGDKIAQMKYASLPPMLQERWKPVKETTDLVVESGKHGIPVSTVSSLIEHAIFAPWPHRGYHPAAERPFMVMAYLPHRLVDMVVGLVFGRVSKQVPVEKPIAPSQAAYQTPVVHEPIDRAMPSTSAVA
jgi:NAD(P)-dependent dehydrogenase (short-subunit alcohol dehydrogenase family)